MGLTYTDIFCGAGGSSIGLTEAGLERTRATFHDVIRATEVHRYRAVIVENVTEAADWELFDWWLGGMTVLGYQHQFVSVSSAHVGGARNPYAPQWRDRLYIVFTRRGIPLPDVSPRPLAWCWTCQEVVTALQAWKKPGARKIGKYGRQYVYVCPSTACGHAQAEPFVLPAAAAIDWSDLGTRIGDRKRPLAANTIRRIRAGLEMFAPAAVVRLTGQDPPESGYVRARPPDSSPLGTITTTRDEALATSPFIVAVGGNTYERPGSGYVRAWPVDDGPMGTRNCTSEQALATPDGAFIAMLRGPHNAPTDIGDPLATVTTGRNHGLVLPLGGANHDRPPTGTGEPMRTRMVRDTDALLTPPFITALRGSMDASGVDEPAPTAMARGHDALTVPESFLVKNYGGKCSPEQNVLPVSGPAGAVTAHDGHALVVPFRGRRSRATTTGEPLHTMATKDSAALVQADDPEVMECRLRMLKPREHLRAQRFPDSYIVTGNQGEQTMQAGNAVSANVAHWLGRAIAEVL